MEFRVRCDSVSNSVDVCGLFHDGDGLGEWLRVEHVGEGAAADREWEVVLVVYVGARGVADE